MALETDNNQSNGVGGTSNDSGIKKERRKSKSKSSRSSKAEGAKTAKDKEMKEKILREERHRLQNEHVKKQIVIYLIFFFTINF